MKRAECWMGLIVLVALTTTACGGPQGHDGDFVRQGATGLEVELPEPAIRITEAFDELLALVEAELSDGEALLAAVTTWVAQRGPEVDAATRQLHHSLAELDDPGRRAMEEQLGLHFHERNLRWRSLRERIAREHPRQSHAITQRISQLQPDA